MLIYGKHNSTGVFCSVIFGWFNEFFVRYFLIISIIVKSVIELRWLVADKIIIFMIIITIQS